MNMVKRWFMETPEGDILDGPYKDKKEFEKVFARYVKRYKYTPLKVCRDMDADQFIQPESYDDHGYQTGKKLEDLCLESETL